MQSALARVIDPSASPWKEGEVSFFRHVGSVINGLAQNARRSARARRETVASPHVYDENHVDGSPLPDEALDERARLEEKRRLGEELGKRLERDDPVAGAVYRAICEGVDGTEEQARHAGCKPEQVRSAYERIKYLGGRILEEYREAEARRMEKARRESRRETLQ